MSLKTLKSLAIAGAIAVTAAGCSGSTGEDEPSQQGSSPTTATEEPAPSDSSTDSPDDSDNSDTDADTDNADATSEDIDLATEETPVSANDALEISAKEVGDSDAAIVHAIELEYSSSKSIWEWSVKTLVDGTDHKVKINAGTGEVIKHEEDSTDDDEKAIDLDDPLPFDEAKEIALDTRDGRIVSWKYEWDDDRFEYEFDIEADGSTEEVNINAETKEAWLD